MRRTGAQLNDGQTPAPTRGSGRAKRRPPQRQNYAEWRVTDDWPEHIPVTKAEVDLFEAYFGDLFDELLGPKR
jgi:hypothetical protein